MISKRIKLCFPHFKALEKIPFFLYHDGKIHNLSSGTKSFDAALYLCELLTTWKRSKPEIAKKRFF